MGMLLHWISTKCRLDAGTPSLHSTRSPFARLGRVVEIRELPFAAPAVARAARRVVRCFQCPSWASGSANFSPNHVVRLRI